GPENVMVSFGAMEALTFALDVTVSPGQEVIIPDPSFPNYLGQVHRLGGVAVSVPVGGQRLQASRRGCAFSHHGADRGRDHQQPLESTGFGDGPSRGRATRRSGR